jgi:uncharacterized membrane protein HdeD (DUF308 family)
MIQGLILLSLISLVFGILVILQPEIIAYLVGIFFIISGIIGLVASINLKGFFRKIK